jgi:hypothetical protein
MSQIKYVQEIFKWFDMVYCESIATLTEIGIKLFTHADSQPKNATLYRQLVGREFETLIHLTTSSNIL